MRPVHVVADDRGAVDLSGSRGESGERRRSVQEVRERMAAHQRGFDALRVASSAVNERLVAHQSASPERPRMYRTSVCAAAKRIGMATRRGNWPGEDRLEELRAVVREQRHDLATRRCATFGGRRPTLPWLRSFRVRGRSTSDSDRLVGVRVGVVVEYAHQFMSICIVGTDVILATSGWMPAAMLPR